MQRSRAPKGQYKALSLFFVFVSVVFVLLFLPAAKAEEVELLPDVTLTVSVPVVSTLTQILPPVTVSVPPITVRVPGPVETVTVPGPTVLSTRTVTGPGATLTETVEVRPNGETVRDLPVTETRTVSTSETTRATTQPTTLVETTTTRATVGEEVIVSETEIKRIFTARDVGISLVSFAVGAVGVVALLYLTRRYTQLEDKEKTKSILRKLRKEASPTID